MLHAYETGISSAHLGLWLVYAFTFLYEQCVGSLMSHRICMCKGCEMGPMVYHPHPRRLESLTVCRCHYKGSTFSSVIWRPWLLVQSRFEPMTSRSADGRLSHWANWAAGRVQSFFKMIGTSDDDKISVWLTADCHVPAPGMPIFQTTQSVRDNGCSWPQNHHMAESC